MFDFSLAINRRDSSRLVNFGYFFDFSPFEPYHERDGEADRLAGFDQCRRDGRAASDSTKDISQKTWKDLKQGATILEAKGAYTGEHKDMLMTITNNLQLKRLENKVFSIDSNALFIVENSFNVIGMNFSISATPTPVKG